MTGRFTDFDQVAERLRKVPGVKSVLPLIEGQALVSSNAAAQGALVRGLREADLMSLKAISDKIDPPAL